MTEELGEGWAHGGDIQCGCADSLSQSLAVMLMGLEFSFLIVPKAIMQTIVSIKKCFNFIGAENVRFPKYPGLFTTEAWNSGRNEKWMLICLYTSTSSMGVNSNGFVQIQNYLNEIKQHSPMHQ